MKTATLVLAAGRSTRFGHADKLIQPMGGMPLIARTLTAIRDATGGPIVLVLGRQPRRQVRALAQHGLLGPRLHICRNTHLDQGLGQSLAVGLRAMPSFVSCINIHLADMPVIGQQLLHRLHRALTSSVDVARATHNGLPGHPVRLRRIVFINAPLADGNGAQPLIRSIPADRRAAVPGPISCVQDIDTRRMRRTLIWRWRTRGFLTQA